MEVSEHGYAAGVQVPTTVASARAVDRFVTSAGAYTTGVLTAQQASDAPEGDGKCLQITVDTAETTFGATTTFQIRERTEGSNVADFDWLDGTTRYYVTTFTVDAADTWERKKLVIPPPVSGKTAAVSFWVKASIAGEYSLAVITIGNADANGFISLFWDLGQGSSFETADTEEWGTTAKLRKTGTVNLMSNSGATFKLTNVQFEEGPEHTEFERRPLALELALCQRYYQRFVGGGNGAFGNAFAASTTVGMAVIQLRQTMRAAPTVATDGIAGHYRFRGASASPPCTVPPSIVQAGVKIVTLTATVASGLVAGQAVVLEDNVSGAWIEFDAEL